jgi:uncharacterized protein DUF4384
MVFLLLAALVQAPPPPTSIPPVDVAARPVRVWLGTTGPLVRGQSVQIFVQAAQDGDLIVLHRRTDGRIEVLFPSNPAADPFVRSGTYEIRGGGNRSAWVVAEPDGSGMVLAALSVDRLRFDEFVHEASWNSNALVPSWNDSNAEGALSDIVQRMLGDGAFNYDLVTYTVAPPIYAQQPAPTPTPEADTLPGEALQQQPDTMPNYGSYPVCLNCTFIGYQEIVIAPQHFGARHAARQDEGICGIHTSCTESQKTHAIALARPTGPAPVMAPRSRSTGESIPYRSRTPATGPVASAAPRTRVASAPLSHVRYTVFSAPESERRVVLVTAAGEARPRTNEERRRGVASVAGGVTPGGAGFGRESRGGGGGGGGAMAMASRAERGTTAVSTPRSAGAAVASRAPAAAPSRGIAVPPAAFQGAQARVPVNRATRRR